MFRSKFSYSDSKSSYSDLLEDIETGKIESIFFYPTQREIDVLYKNGNKFKIPILYNDQLILEKATVLLLLQLDKQILELSQLKLIYLKK